MLLDGSREPRLAASCGDAVVHAVEEGRVKRKTRKNKSLSTSGQPYVHKPDFPPVLALGTKRKTSKSKPSSLLVAFSVCYVNVVKVFNTITWGLVIDV